MTETIPAIVARHKAERIAVIIAQRDAGLTQTQAAQNLAVSVTTLNNAIHRNNIPWPLKRRGYRTTEAPQ
jgi:DNA-directed RNA polymerase specialized sigma24 family protein